MEKTQTKLPNVTYAERYLKLALGYQKNYKK